jgi:bifunctional non-homologous end joining protein LigD
MGLHEYRRKRDFGKTPEPAGRGSAPSSKSVATGRTLEEIATADDRVRHSNRDGQDKRALAPEVPGARRAPLPKFVPPELATLVDRPPDGDQWLHEFKHDGYRILARLDHRRVELYSRNANDWTQRFPTVAAAVARLPAEQAIFDGEVTVLLPDGTSSFQALQNHLSGIKTGQLVYMIFDLLHLDGRDLTPARLEDRKAALARLLASARDKAAVLRYSDHVEGSGAEFFAHACGLGLEGIVSKRRDAPYRGSRGADWLKVKCLKEQEVVIGGYTDPEGSRVGIGALLCGVYDHARLEYAGKVGTGFDNRTLRELKARLAKLEQDASPFATRPVGVGQAHWVKPQLVAQVSFTEWTSDGKLRHPAFHGLREDKPASDVFRERPSKVDGGGKTKSAPSPTPAPRDRSSRAVNQPPADPPPANSGDAMVAGVRLTHPDRVLYPSQGTTKRDLALFYESIAKWILPHLEDRPTSLVRCPDGVDKPCFYQKHVGTWAPESLRRVKIQEKRKIGEYLVVDSLASLIGLVQIGILEIHTWNSVVRHLEQPDRVVFDLDPGPGVEWSAVIECARFIRESLRTVHLESFVKSSGSKGLHVVVPLVRGPSWDETAEFARAVAESAARAHPSRYVAHMAKAARRGRIFIDYLRNVRGATTVAAYSTRATPQATVSVPLTWDELSPRIRSDHFTIANLPARLDKLKTDPWAAYWTARQRLPKASAPRRSR